MIIPNHLDVLVRCSKKGYINKKLFAEYGKQLIYHIAEQEPNYLHKGNLLLMDSHYSHIFNYAFMRMMWRRNIKVSEPNLELNCVFFTNSLIDSVIQQVMALEAHSSHVLQPLDKNPFSAFKHCFNSYLRKWN